MNKFYHIILILVFIFSHSFSKGQDQIIPENNKQISDSTENINKLMNIKIDSINNEMKKVVVMQRVKESGIDTVVNYKAKDTIVFNVKSQKMYLRGNSEIKFKEQQLNSEIIEISFKESEMNAAGMIDSNKKLIGYPKFSDKGEDFYGQKIRFNFKSAKGLIDLGETQIKEGFYFGEKIKRINEKEYYVCDGYYTTCDNPEPHFHFGSKKMKVIAEDRVLLDPLVLYIEDLPVMIVPFGLFFPSSGGRQSGLIVPTFAFSKSRGVVFQNLGFYWAASEYWDTQFKTDLYSKGGFMIKNNTRWSLKNTFSGNFDFEYGRTRYNVDEEYQTNWRFVLNHTQDFTPYDKVVLNLNFYSQNFNRNTLTNNNDYITQSIRSSASYSKQFDNRTTLSLSYDRDQNIINDEFSQTATARYNIPSTKIFKGIESLPQWMKDITFNYSVNGNYRNTKKGAVDTNQVVVNDTLRIDTLKYFNYDHSQRIEHRPSINISPKLGYFTFRPYINFSLNNYFRKVNKSYNKQDSAVVSDTTWGFYSEYSYGAGLNISTILYGIADDNNPFLGFIKPSALGIKAFRHTYNPTIGWSVRPDQSSPDLGFFGSYYNEKSKMNVIYSHYDLDGGGLASRNFSSSINYSDVHSFDIKVAQGDTLPDQNLELLKLNFSTSYDFAKDSLNLNDINLQFRSPALKFIDLSGSANFRLYEELLVMKRDSISGNVTPDYVTTNNFLFSQGKGIARLTNFSLSLSTSFSSTGIQLTESAPVDTTQKKDSVSFGERFTKRYYGEYVEDDIWGDHTPGYTPFTFPWSLRLSLYYSYSKATINPASKSEVIDFRLNGNVKLSETWALNFSGGYDFLRHELSVPQLNLIKDLHCWEMIFNWTPVGGNSGFYLKIGIKTPTLKDLKFEKQNNPMLR